MTSKGIVVRSPDTQDIHISTKISKPAVAPPRPQLGLFPWAQATEDVVDHLNQTSVVVMKEWSYARAPHLPPCRAQVQLKFIGRK
jgi:hypothetical protein